MSHIPDEKFLEMVQHMPLVSVDLILCDKDSRILLGLRANDPAKGTWYFPGGRIFKDESIESAVTRIGATEIGLRGKKMTKCIGINEWFFPTNFYGAEGISTHYVALAFMVLVEPHEIDARVADNQHRALEWMTLDEIKRNPEVSPDVIHVVEEMERRKYLPIHK